MRNGHKIRFARYLRRTMTDAERAIWHHLRNRALMGHKFRRQYPVGPPVVDFACPARRLVVELDGGQHGPAVDAGRTRHLERCGYRILRFWNNDVFEQQDAVLAAILDALSHAPSPNEDEACPSPSASPSPSSTSPSAPSTATPNASRR